jgi:TldD protein
MDHQLARDAVRALLADGGDFADLFYEDTVFSMLQAEDGRMEKAATGRERGAGLRLVKRGSTRFGSTVDVSPEGILSLARELAEGGGEGKCAAAGAAPSTLRVGVGAEVQVEEGELRLVPLEDKAALALAGVDAARAQDRRVASARVVVRDSISRVLVANSRGALAAGERSQAVFLVHAVVAEGGRRETGHENAGGPDAAAVLAGLDPAAVARTACRRALLTLGAPEAPSGVMTVVLSSEAGGTMVHEAVGHGLEADLVEKGVSAYRGRLGRQVASPLVSVVDDPTLPGRRGSYAFDDEGTAALRTVLVEDGMLKAYLNDLLTAERMGIPANAHGRRQSFRHWPLTRMGNTMILPGKDLPQDIVRSVERGLLVKKMGGGQVNPANGDFVFEVAEGYLVEKGEVAGPVRGATLAGNGPEVLSRVDMVGHDLGFGIGTCGKDGQGVPVSDAQPTLRIPGIAVGGRDPAGGR